MKLTHHDIPIGVSISKWRRVALDRGIHYNTFNGRVERGSSPREAADPGYPWRNRWDGVETLSGLCRENGITPASVHTWKRRHPDHGLTDDEVVEIVSSNKQRRSQ